MDKARFSSFAHLMCSCVATATLSEEVSLRLYLCPAGFKPVVTQRCVTTGLSHMAVVMPYTDKENNNGVKVNGHMKNNKYAIL